MQLLGSYNSTFQAFYYQQLLSLYQQAVANGQYQGTVFNEAAIQTIIAASKAITEIPVETAGDIVIDDSLNHPLDLLSAVYTALISETNAYTSVADSLISVAEKDTVLLDQLIAGASLNNWVQQQIPITGETVQFSWDFQTGQGRTDSVIADQDPANGVIYPLNTPTGVFLDVTVPDLHGGLTPPVTSTIIQPKEMIWTWTPAPGEQSQDIYGSDWAELDLLETNPLINFLPNPTTQVLLPEGGTVNNVFNIQGVSNGGSLPIYVQTLFTPRRNIAVIAPTNEVQDGSFENGGMVWTLGTDWSIDTTGNAHTGVNCARLTYNPSHGYLVSAPIPVTASQQVYVEFWMKSISAVGTLNTYISCQDTNSNEISQVFMPTLTPSQTYEMISSVLTITNDIRITKCQIKMIGGADFVSGAWYVDDFRIHTPITVSPYPVDPDSVSVYTTKADGSPSTVYLLEEGYVTDSLGEVTIMDVPDGGNITIRFTEGYPSYQCSINGTNWSPIIMLDPSRPYPDNATSFEPIVIGVDNNDNRTLFPITDEEGIPTGLTIQMIGRPLYEYLLIVTTPAQSNYGATAMLEVDLATPSYINGIQLSPYSEFPITLTQVQTQSFNDNTIQTVSVGQSLIDRPMTITFPTQLVRKIFLTCYQQNYTLSNYEVQAPNQLSIDTFASLQSSLPLQAQTAVRSTPSFYTGAEYIFGFENIAGVNNVPNLPGVFVSGPWTVNGVPEVISLSTDQVGTISYYLCFKAYDANEVTQDEQLFGYALTPGTPIVFPYSVAPNTLNIDHVDVYLKIVLRSANAICDKFLIQTTVT